MTDRIGLQVSTVTRPIGRPEAQDPARRTAAPGDGRAVAAGITEAGRQRYAEATPTYRAALGAAMGASLSNVFPADLAAWVRTGESAVRSTPHASEGIHR
ncbi:MarR family winged helix-turn-helix transcriptional regulator [Streptomyces sp. BHT-5-2]|uniref:MarR family winged helix-turn-helix transcriptional regulator n=1 Tax=Streptomyces sp. BHT-5-2 TaxID=2866715 RepID=UPI001C8E3E8A|nr:MarR family winged helix-turn-helix transcriptional regulator [Streptomyces sp. BHT-5-2]QZL05300.1 MarR family winged helix-turn-helix transcriptional regulator [Streptomyces sp. BHT-5-2]